MRNINLLGILCLLMFTSYVRAQDVHFTRFYDAPITLNPAKAGDFYGTFRLGGIFRDQNYNLSNVYLTPTAYIDAPILKGFKDNHWVGIGFNLMQDRAGIAGMRNTGITGALAYHLGVTKDMSSYFTVGISYGLQALSVADKSKLNFEDQIITPGSSADFDIISDEKVNYTNLSAGLQYTAGLESGGNIKVGFAMSNLNKPRVGVLKSATQRTPFRFNIYATGDTRLNDKIDLIPALYISTMGGHRDIAAQMQAGVKLNPLKNIRLIGGLGYRFGDAVQILAGFDHKRTRVGVAYDATHNPIKPTGGFEVAVSHIVMIYKKPKDNPIILCPRL